MRAAIHIKNHTSEHLEGKLALVEALHRRGVEVIDKWTPDIPIDIIISILSYPLEATAPCSVLYTKLAAAAYP